MPSSKVETMDFFRLNGRLCLNMADNTTGALQITGTIFFIGLGNFASDAAAAAGSVAIGQLYRNGSIVMVRVA